MNPEAMNIQVDGIGAVSAPLQIVLLLTLISFLPAILVTMTSFTRIAIVFHFLRQALGTQEMPSNQILIGLALFLTMFIMAPVGAQINELAVEPAMAGQVTRRPRRSSAARRRCATFMLQADPRGRPRALHGAGQGAEGRRRATELPMTVVMPAYVISELKTGFQMGFFLFVPFLLIDLVVSTTLLSMGMMQLPPAMVSLPFKVLLFVMIDGWNLLVGSIVRSFALAKPMPEALVVGVVRQAIETAIIVSLPMLLAGLVAGVLVSIFQTVTSIQDNVLAFIPRAAAIFAVFALTFPWMLRVLTGFSTRPDPAAARVHPVIDLARRRAVRAAAGPAGHARDDRAGLGGTHIPAPVKIGADRAPRARAAAVGRDAARAAGDVVAGARRRARGRPSACRSRFVLRALIAGAEFAGHLSG